MGWDNVRLWFMRFIGIGLALVIVYAILYPFINKDCCMCGVVTNNCCPCPNNEWFDTVEEWAGYEASSAGSWLFMCEEYQEANNISFNCFE